MLKKNGICIMTVKSVTKNITKHISVIRKELEGKLEIERIAVLPSNRQELTILCRKRAGSR
jgi:hypothetical protein